MFTLYIYICMFTLCTRIYIHTYTHRYILIQTCIHACSHHEYIYIYIYIYTLIQTCIHACSHHEYMCVCIYIYIYTHTYILIQTCIHACSQVMQAVHIAFLQRFYRAKLSISQNCSMSDKVSCIVYHAVFIIHIYV
jgi:hypothetical protein